MTTAEIALLVRRHLGMDGSSITAPTCRQLIGGDGEGLEMWRLSGTAVTDGIFQPWSMVLKGWPPQEPGAVPSAWNWTHRETERYRSGLLTDLPGGIRAPNCYGATEQPDGSIWLWLEELTDASEGPWSLDRYATVAWHLGQFNGTYLAGRSLPGEPWLSRHWLRQWVEAAAPAVVALTSAANHPLVRQVCAPRVAEAYTCMWAERHTQYAVMDRLPQTFCHLDAFRRNLFMQWGAGDAAETVLIDRGSPGSAKNWHLWLQRVSYAWRYRLKMHGASKPWCWC